MKLFRYIVVFQLFIFLSLGARAQADRHEVRTGNRKFKKGNWAEADIAYRKALVRDSSSIAANYNLANNLYRQGNMQEATSYMEKIKETAPFSSYASDYYYNSGDIAVAGKDWKAAVDAFKQALMRNPGDMDAKENYIYAKKMLENQKNKQNQDNKDNQNKDNQNKDNQDQQDKQNQDNKDNQNNKDQQKNDQGQQPQGQGQQKISPQQAQQMLKAIQAKEKETQDKVNKEKAAVLKSRQKDKNW